MIVIQILQEVRENIQAVIKQEGPVGVQLWQQFIKLHPADIAQFLADIDRLESQLLFLLLPRPLKKEVFIELSWPLQIDMLACMDDGDRVAVLAHMPVDELTDLFDQLSDADLEKYMTLLHKKDREQVISLMKFSPESAGGVMDVNVWSLVKDFTVEKSIHFLRRLPIDRELHRVIYLTTKENILVGHIMLEDLVLQPSKKRLEEFVHENELVVRADQDQEEVAQNMLHYSLTTAPVVGTNNEFLGIITSDTLAEIIEEEHTEDVYKLSAMKPIKQTYFDTPFFRLLFERGYILVILLLAESISGLILNRYEMMIKGIPFLVLFIPMLMSTGGNTSHQTSALVIRGMASGEINSSNMNRFLRREFLMAGMIALILGITAFIRVLITTGQAWTSFTVSFACAAIVMSSVTLGSGMPILLRKMNIDPMFSAGPALATLMDVLGILIYCYISRLLLS